MESIHLPRRHLIEQPQYRLFAMEIARHIRKGAAIDEAGRICRVQCGDLRGTVSRDPVNSVRSLKSLSGSAGSNGRRVLCQQIKAA